jgi:hypothetical protein
VSNERVKMRGAGFLLAAFAVVAFAAGPDAMEALAGTRVAVSPEPAG